THCNAPRPSAAARYEDFQALMAGTIGPERTSFERDFSFVPTPNTTIASDGPDGSLTLLLYEKPEPFGACTGDLGVGLFLPGHLVPAALFDEFTPRPATYLPEFLELRFMIMLLHKLGDADRRLTRHDCFRGGRIGGA